MIEKATLEEMVDDLSRRVSRLESGVVRNYGPLEAAPARPLPPAGWPYIDPASTVARCGKCGIFLSGVMSYTCAQSDCPTGLGGVSCTTVTTGYAQNAVGDGATLAKVFPLGEDGPLLAQGYSENL